jgi:hypothetical protein
MKIDSPLVSAVYQNKELNSNIKQLLLICEDNLKKNRIFELGMGGTYYQENR